MATLTEVTSRSGRGRWERVPEARKQAREALGLDPNSRDLCDAAPKPKAGLKTPYPIQFDRSPPTPGVRVLSLGEAAIRLGVSRSQLEAMIAAGKIEALPTGYTRMIPTREVKRLEALGSSSA